VKRLCIAVTVAWRRLTPAVLKFLSRPEPKAHSGVLVKHLKLVTSHVIGQIVDIGTGGVPLSMYFNVMRIILTGY
jgi:hypothetical protein